MSCEEFVLEVTEPILGYKTTTSLLLGTPVNQNTLHPLPSTPPQECGSQCERPTLKTLMCTLGAGTSSPPHLPMKAERKLSWISVTGHLAVQLRQRKSMLDGKCSGNICCIPSPNNFVLKHFISKSAGETFGQTVSKPTFTSSPAAWGEDFPLRGICCRTKCFSTPNNTQQHLGQLRGLQIKQTSLFFPYHANFLNKLFAHFGSKPVLQPVT